MRNAGLDELQAGIKIARRNINKLRYADDTTLTTESEDELKSLLMKLKEENEKASIKLNIKKKIKIMTSSPISSRQIEGENVEAVTDFLFLDSKITTDGEYSHEIKRCLLLEEKQWQPRQHIKKQKHYFADKGPLSQSYGVSSSYV